MIKLLSVIIVSLITSSAFAEKLIAARDIIIDEKKDLTEIEVESGSCFLVHGLYAFERQIKKNALFNIVKVTRGTTEKLTLNEILDSLKLEPAFGFSAVTYAEFRANFSANPTWSEITSYLFKEKNIFPPSPSWPTQTAYTIGIQSDRTKKNYVIECRNPSYDLTNDEVLDLFLQSSLRPAKAL